MLQKNKISTSHAAGILYGCLLMLLSCGPSSGNDEQMAKAANIQTQDTTEGLITTEDLSEEPDYATVYTVVVDTGLQYTNLQQMMYDISRETGLDVDTMGRYYDTEKQRIVLPDTAEDEIYRGDYYPRRGSSTALSIEYYTLYDTAAIGRTMALIAGLYDDRHSADSILEIIHARHSQAWIINAWMYMGCLH